MIQELDIVKNVIINANVSVIKHAHNEEITKNLIDELRKIANDMEEEKKCKVPDEAGNGYHYHYCKMRHDVCLEKWKTPYEWFDHMATTGLGGSLLLGAGGFTQAFSGLNIASATLGAVSAGCKLANRYFLEQCTFIGKQQCPSPTCEHQIDPDLVITTSRLVLPQTTLENIEKMEKANTDYKKN